MSDPIEAGGPLAEGYEVREHLSRGNTLDVYAVWNFERDCLCVAKVARPDRRDEVTIACLRHEGHLLSTLAHPHLARGLEVTENGHGPVVIMQTLAGATLSRTIETEGDPGLDPDDVALLGRQLCSVLHYLHAHGQLHLDLKPSNIVVCSGTAVLFDLSLAQPPGRCAPGSGTAEYISPEQLRGGPVEASSDTWGLGGVLYRAQGGRRPFARTGTPREPDQVPAPLPVADTDPRLRSLARACLSVSPADRPTLAEVRAVLDEVLAQPLTLPCSPPAAAAR